MQYLNAGNKRSIAVSRIYTFHGHNLRVWARYKQQGHTTLNDFSDISLETLLSQGRLELSVCLRIAAGVADCLATVHAGTAVNRRF